METFVKGRNLSNDEKRIKLSETLNKALYLESIGKKIEAEKLFLKSCRISENLYRQTFSNKDRIKVVECYIKISEFYQNSELRMDFVQRWYQKIIGVLQDSSKINSSMDEFRYLMEWYVKTIYLMFGNCDYNHIIITSKKMLEKSKYLYRKTKTNEDLKFIILSKFFISFSRLFPVFSRYLVAPVPSSPLYPWAPLCPPFSRLKFLAKSQYPLLFFRFSVSNRGSK